jgi:hypothetical protein
MELDILSAQVTEFNYLTVTNLVIACRERNLTSKNLKLAAPKSRSGQAIWTILPESMYTKNASQPEVAGW